MSRDFRTYYRKLEEGEPLVPGIWYRTPLYNNDHLLGERKEWQEQALAWCGRPLQAARDWPSDELGGLWVSERTSGKCGPCKTKQKEWESQ